MGYAVNATIYVSTHTCFYSMTICNLFQYNECLCAAESRRDLATGVGVGDTLDGDVQTGNADKSAGNDGKNGDGEVNPVAAPSGDATLVMVAVVQPEHASTREKSC